MFPNSKFEYRLRHGPFGLVFGADLMKLDVGFRERLQFAVVPKGVSDVGGLTPRFVLTAARRRRREVKHDERRSEQQRKGQEFFHLSSAEQTADFRTAFSASPLRTVYLSFFASGLGTTTWR